MMLFLRALARLNDHWLGDLLGAALLFVVAYQLMMIGVGLGFQ